MTKKCTILISSCDAYADILPAFFTLLKKYWPDLEYDIALSTESTNYHDSDLDIINLHPNTPNLSWTERIYDALTKIKSKQIILLCDDFFLYDKVDNTKIEETINWLSRDPAIASFTYWPLLYESLPSKFPGFSRRRKDARYKIAVIAGAWNKYWLKKYLRNAKESAWQFEPDANERSYRMLNPGKFYAMLNSQDTIFPYNFMTLGLFSGKWLPDTEQLFIKNGIKMDYEKRGFYDPRFSSTQKSTQDAFSLRSRLLPNRYYKNNDHSLIKPFNVIQGADGHFSESFKLSLGKDCVRWIVADHTGFSISDFHVFVDYADGDAEVINNTSLSGSFVYVKNSLVFNHGTPIVFIVTKPQKQISEVTISGVISFPAPKALLSAAYEKDTPAASQHRIIINQNWLEMAISDENLGFIYLEPAITFYHQNKKLSSIQETKFLGGHFSYTYELPKSTNRFVWNPANNVGFYIKNLNVIEILSNRQRIIHDSGDLTKYLPIIKHNIFCRLSDHQLDMPLHKGCIEIIISGNMIKPIPSSLMAIATNTHP